MQEITYRITPSIIGWVDMEHAKVEANCFTFDSKAVVYQKVDSKCGWELGAVFVLFAEFLNVPLVDRCIDHSMNAGPVRAK